MLKMAVELLRSHAAQRNRRFSTACSVFIGFVVAVVFASAGPLWFTSTFFSSLLAIDLAASGELGISGVNDRSVGRSQNAAHDDEPRQTPVIPPRFYELKRQVQEQIRAGSLYEPSSSYRNARVVNESTSWFQPRRICRETCCAESLAVSLDHEVPRIVNTLDGADLADVRIIHYEPSPWQVFASNIFNPATIPCFQPGTIFFLENNFKILKYFFRKIRPKITVPYIVITSKSDGDSPYYYSQLIYGRDPKLLKWYGTNPWLKNSTGDFGRFVPMHLGLSQRFKQEYFLRLYLELTNFTNPFLNKDPWLDLLKRPPIKNSTIYGPDDIFVHFGLDQRNKPERKVLWKALCPETTTNILKSCQRNTNHLGTADIYVASSYYRFGVTPPGVGWDCYRTYELLMLGIIPIVERRPGIGEALFEGLPVIQIDNLLKIESMQELERHVENYLRSDAFQNTTFDGWERLFLGYWRRKILNDAGRSNEIIRDEQGREYYQVWKYTPANDKLVVCSQVGSCQ